MKYILKDKLSSIQKKLVGFFLLCIIVSISLMFNGIQNIIISIVENLVLGRLLNNPFKWHSLLTLTSIFGILLSFLFIALVLFYKQLLSILNMLDVFLNKVLTKRISGISIKEILVKQPFLLIFLLFILYLVKNIFLVINITGFDGLVIVLTLLTHITVFLFIYHKKDKFIIPILTCYFILVFSMLLNSFIFDYSYDGQAYHQTAAIQLNNGWNPFYSYLPEEDVGVFFWNNHYPKFTEMFASILLSVFNNIELGKSYNIIFFIIVFLYALKYTNKFHKNKLVVMAITIIFTANPVVLAQFFTYYVDGVMGMLIIILFLACMEYEQSQSITDLLIIIAVSVFSINTKFTGFICGFVLIAYIIKQLVVKKYKMMTVLICAGFVILIIGVVFTGYNPYITNTRDFGHPLYPVFGHETIDIISAHMALIETAFEEFKFMHPIQRFFSLFFMLYTIDSIPFNIMKLIILASPYSVFRFHSYHIYIGGFGVLLAEICILLFIILFFTIKNNNIINSKKLLFPIIILLFITIIMPGNWWARYIPYFWYLFGFLAIAGNYKRRLNKTLFFVCFILVIINSGAFLFFNTFNGIKYTMELKSTLKEMKESNHDTIHIVLQEDFFRYSLAEKFRYYNIQKNIIFIEEEEEDAKFSNGVPLSYIKGWY
jgi:hypothetical protein